VAETNPFIIKIEPGATEIDLGPILRPLIFAIKNNGLLDPDELEKYWRGGQEGLAYRTLLPLISRSMVCDYLKNTGWVDEDQDSDGGPRGYTFIRDYQLKQHSWDRSGPWIRMGSPSEELSVRRANDVIEQIAHADYDKTKIDVAKAIIANSNILDRIVNELD